MKSGLAAMGLFLMITAQVAAQSERGAIAGTITDASGAVVPKAKITARNLATGETRRAISGADGGFSLPELKADPWQVTVEAEGFKTATVERVQVAVQVTQRVDIALTVGQITESITVEDAAALIQSDNPTQQTNVTEQQVRELPLEVAAESGGRTPLAFIFLDSTVSSATGSGTNATNFRVGGGQGLGAEILIDGAGTRRAQNGTFFSEVAPGPNAFQEFTISTSSYSAEFGNSSGGIVNFTLKSGGNRLRGEAYEYFRNEALNANTYLNNARGIPRNRDRQNNFGGNVGGPLTIPKLFSGRDRAFFFTNYEGYRFKRAEITDVTIPTLKMRNGDFSELLTDPYVLNPASGIGKPVQIYDPTEPPDRRTPIPGNRIDLYKNGALLDPVGLAVIRAYPKPTSEGVFRNYRAVSAAPNTMNSIVNKIDWHPAAQHHLAGSYSYRRMHSYKGGFPKFEPPLVASGVWNQYFYTHYVRLRHDFVLAPNKVNALTIGGNRVVVANLNFTVPMDTSKLGLPANATQNMGFPLVGFPTYTALYDPRGAQGIGSTSFHDTMADNTLQITNHFSWVRGKHSFKAGGDFRKQQLNITQLLDVGGRFNFRHEQTASNADPTGGWPLASLIMGATEWSWVTITTTQPAWRYSSGALFVNNDMRLLRRLTLTLGFRYEVALPRAEVHNRYRGFDPLAMNPVVNRPGAIAGAGGQGGVTARHRGLIAPTWSNVSPRAGIAWSPKGRTTIRGGFGIYYSPLLYGYNGSNDPAGGIIGYRTSRNLRPTGTGARQSSAFLRNYPDAPQPNPAGQFIGEDVDYFTEDFKNSRTYQWSVDLQRAFPGRLAASAAYTGHKGTRLRSNFSRLNGLPLEAMKLGNPLLTKRLANVTAAERNYAAALGFQLPASPSAVYPGFDGTVAKALAPFPQYGRIHSVMESLGSSDYHALTLRLNRRLSPGLQFGVSYTFSKLLTNASDDLFGGSPLNTVIQNPYDLGSLRAIAPNHAPHNVVMNFLYQLPVGRGRRYWNKTPVLSRLLGGWQVAGIQRYQSGLAYVVHSSDGGARNFLDTLGYYGNIRPNLTGQPLLTGNPVFGESVFLLNKGAFALPPSFSTPPTTNVSDPAYAAYYANPSIFFGNSAPVLAGTRALAFYSEDWNVLKRTRIKERRDFEIGAEFFNVFNRHRYGRPETNLRDMRDPNFGRALVTGAVRVIQLRARFIF